MKIKHRSSGKIRQCYAKIQWKKRSGIQTLYLIKRGYGGAGPIQKDDNVIWIHPDLKNAHDSDFTDNYYWVQESEYKELSYSSNEEALSLLMGVDE